MLAKWRMSSSQIGILRWQLDLVPFDIHLQRTIGSIPYVLSLGLACFNWFIRLMLATDIFW